MVNPTDDRMWTEGARRVEGIPCEHICIFVSAAVDCRGIESERVCEGECESDSYAQRVTTRCRRNLLLPARIRNLSH